jgi:hypothetical protein
LIVFKWDWDKLWVPCVSGDACATIIFKCSCGDACALIFLHILNCHIWTLPCDAWTSFSTTLPFDEILHILNLSYLDLAM